MVHLVKKKVKNSITLAIGDGANDVSMIQVKPADLIDSFDSIMYFEAFLIMTQVDLW